STPSCPTSASIDVAPPSAATSLSTASASAPNRRCRATSSTSRPLTFPAATTSPCSSISYTALPIPTAAWKLAAASAWRPVGEKRENSCLSQVTSPYNEGCSHPLEQNAVTDTQILLRLTQVLRVCPRTF